MKTLGIVAEYNPFHNGHKYHIEKSKEISKCTNVVCVMSGSFVQRGEFAINDKWERAKSALLNGADLVLELPTYYVLQSAKNFAYGAVNLLNSLGVVDYISFGSESESIDDLKKVASVIDDSNEKYNSFFKKYINEGFSYPAARNMALSEYGFNELTPNDLLGIYYLSALSKLNSNIIPLNITRYKTLHNSCEQNDGYATASYIRNMIKNNDDVKDFVPKTDNLAENFFIENISDYVLGFLRFSNYLDDLIGYEEGLSLYIKDCAKKSHSLNEFYEISITKRYTKSRIKRCVLSALIGLKTGKKLDYIRVLGFNKNGAKLLKEIKKKTNLPIVVKTADFRPDKDSMFGYDVLSTDLAYFSSKNKNIGMDFKTSPIVL
ncbi:MAG: nucleotidyltransferase [Ruminococcaceae bacterium]|nr:nucleotidyltransferase [Oscillospiraceae bacterium]